MVTADLIPTVFEAFSLVCIRTWLLIMLRAAIQSPVQGWYREWGAMATIKDERVQLALDGSPLHRLLEIVSISSRTNAAIILGPVWSDLSMDGSFRYRFV